jgi:hypothetical protein
LEQNGLRSRATAEGKGAHSFGGSVCETIQHLVQAFMTQGLHKMFNVRTGQALESVEFQGGIFSQGRTIDLIGNQR